MHRKKETDTIVEDTKPIPSPSSADPPQEASGEVEKKEEKEPAVNTESSAETQPTEPQHSEPVENENHTEEVEASSKDKDSGKKRHGKRKNHHPTQMDIDPMFVPRDSRYFCHDIRGEASYLPLGLLTL